MRSVKIPFATTALVENLFVTNFYLSLTCSCSSETTFLFEKGSRVVGLLALEMTVLLTLAFLALTSPLMEQLGLLVINDCVSTMLSINSLTEADVSAPSCLILKHHLSSNGLREVRFTFKTASAGL